MTRRALLYTEMVTADAVIHGDRGRLIGFDPAEHPLALQLGGCDPAALARAARLAEPEGYGEVNLNVGCPSPRVREGRFGACLMREPKLVGECVAAMRAAIRIPVTVKCRLGVDEQDPETALDALADAVIAAGAGLLVVHARKAWLQGLSPRENRDVPPLDHDRVMRLRARVAPFPIVLNGGLTTLSACRDALTRVDGVMMGRAAYHDPEMLLGVDPLLFGQAAPAADAFEVVERCEPLIAARLQAGMRLSAMTRHMLGLFAGRPGARAWRRHLAVEATKPGAGLATLRAALAALRRGDDAKAA